MSKQFRVWLKSVPGFMAQYDGYVDVLADDENDARGMALTKLKKGPFPGRDASCWRITKVERLR